MRKLIITLTLTTIALAASAERVKSTFNIFDDWGAPVTNACLEIVTPRDAYTLSWNGSIPHTKHFTMTDEKGIASCSFASPQRCFTVYIIAPGYYPEEKSNISFGSTNEINVPILMRKIIKPISMIKTKLVCLPFPSDKGTFYVDLEKGDWVLPGRKGVVADLSVEYSCHDSEGRTESTAKITFLSGGAYKRKKIVSSCFQSEYSADTNEVFNASFLHSLSFDTKGHGNRISSLALEKDEYLVFRTRVVRDKDGKIVSANYGKIYGEIAAFRNFGYRRCFFNPIPNDVGLEEMEAYEVYKSRQSSTKR